MLEKYRGLGLKRYYLIFGMCDESFSINCSAEIPEGVDRGWFYFWVTLLTRFLPFWVFRGGQGRPMCGIWGGPCRGPSSACW